MYFKALFLTYIQYLIHPFESHKKLLNSDFSSSFQKLSVYESLSFSWIFILINALGRVIILNFVLLAFKDIILSSTFDLSEIMNFDDFGQFYFFIFSIILDVIFYPLFAFFLIQFWEVIFSFYARLLKTTGDVSDKIHNILAVSFSTQMLKVVPILGGMAQSIASFISVYAGIRIQLQASPLLSLCILFTPFLIMLGFFSVLILLFALAM